MDIQSSCWQAGGPLLLEASLKCRLVLSADYRRLNLEDKRFKQAATALEFLACLLTRSLYRLLAVCLPLCPPLSNWLLFAFPALTATWALSGNRLQFNIPAMLCEKRSMSASAGSGLRMGLQAESVTPSSFLLEGLGVPMGPGAAMCFECEQLAKLLTCGKMNPNLF